jgi:hypothetical protein
LNMAGRQGEERAARTALAARRKTAQQRAAGDGRLSRP